MRHIKNLSFCAVVLFSIMVFSSGCKKMFGLKLQENWEFQPVVLDPHINKTAWQFLKDRALGTTPADTIFKRMYDGIIYSGIDTGLYLQTNKTFIFLHNDAVYRKSGSTITTDCYFGYYKIGSPLKAASKWEDYSKDSVKNWLLYLIAEGNHSFGSVGPINVEAKTLLPEGTDPKNPSSLMYFMVQNTADMKFRINDFIGSKRVTQARTAGILATNGPVHVVDRIVEFNQ